MHRWGFWGLGALAWVAVACGGSSSSSNAGDGGSAGAAGGAATGGTAGMAGGAATGGVAGSTSGGTGGVAGSASGGTGATATGGAAGSAGGAGAGGAAGSGSVGDRCDPLCDALVAASCQDGPTRSGCLVTCKALTSASACDPKASAYFDCADAATIECNAQNEPVARGCGLDWLAAIGCAVQESPNQALVQPCDSYCDAVVAANCGSNGTKDQCNTRCLWAGVTGTGCDDEWGTFLDCANGVTLSCLAGYAIAPGCGTEFNAYRQCMQAAGT